MPTTRRSRSSARLSTPAIAALALAAALVLASCGSSGGDGSVKTKSGSGSNAVDTTSAPLPTGPDGKPKIPQTPPDARNCRSPKDAESAAAPAVPKSIAKETSIRVVDDIPGCGKLVSATASVNLRYQLVVKSTGKVLDSSWQSGQPFSFTLGTGSVIPGWDVGIPGMRTGGRRTLYLGPDYAYGASGSPPDIAPDDTLVFVIDMLSAS
jgi:peptidylprolyl isomerase